MLEVYIITRTDTEQYYHSLTPGGDMLWTDNRDHGQWLLEKDAEKLIDRVNGQGNPKYDELKIEPA